MLSKEDYLKRVTTLGCYCYHERAGETAAIVFASLKKTLSEEKMQDIIRLLPEPVKGLCMEADFKGPLNGTDCITIAKEMGDYPYRAAAEKAFEVIFASIREIIDDDKKIKISNLLPLPLRQIFEGSKSCVLDGSPGDFL